MVYPSDRTSIEEKYGRFEPQATRDSRLAAGEQRQYKKWLAAQEVLRQLAAQAAIIELPKDFRQGYAAVPDDDCAMLYWPHEWGMEWVAPRTWEQSDGSRYVLDSQTIFHRL